MCNLLFTLFPPLDPVLHPLCPSSSSNPDAFFVKRSFVIQECFKLVKYQYAYHVDSLLASGMGCSGKAANLLARSPSVIPISLTYHGKLHKMPPIVFASSTKYMILKQIRFSYFFLNILLHAKTIGSTEHCSSVVHSVNVTLQKFMLRSQRNAFSLACI